MFRITTFISGITLNPIDEKEGPKHGDSFDYDVETEKEALDLFHDSVPIKVLEDYEIDCQEIKPDQMKVTKEQLQKSKDAIDDRAEDFGEYVERAGVKGYSYTSDDISLASEIITALLNGKAIQIDD